MYLDHIYNSIILTIEKNKGLLTNDFINNYLDLRDSENFDKNWISAYDHFESISNKSEEFILNEKKLRERIFKKVVQLTHNYELAEYISDDSGLIYANFYFKSKNSFVNYIFQCYENYNLPSVRE